MKSNYLTIEQQIFILELSKKDLYGYPHFGLCAIVKNNLKKTLDLSDCIEDIEIAQYIPTFTYENALLFKANNLLNDIVLNLGESIKETVDYQKFSVKTKEVIKEAFSLAKFIQKVCINEDLSEDVVVKFSNIISNIEEEIRI